MSSIGEDAIVDRLRRYGINKMDKKRTVPIDRIKNAPLHVQTQVEEIHRWLFVEGGHFEDIESLMTNYCHYVCDNLHIPLDRLYYGGLGLHPKVTAYLWKWELDSFEYREMPQEIFERRKELFSPDEPFCVLEEGNSDFIRIRSSDNYIPSDTEKWFRGGNYEDYFALPDIHRGEFKGGLAWSTKHPEGFDDEHILFFELTQPALSTVMRLHTNDLVLKTLTERMEREIEERTSQLATANTKLEKASAEIARNAAKQLEHFACMSHEIRTPLNCIVGLSSLMLESEQMSPENDESIRMIHENGNLLKCVVDDVLDYAKLESGCFMVNIQPCELHPTISSVVKSIAQKANKRGVVVRTDYSAKLSDVMETDNRRLQQVLFNLLGNAEKFSKVGGVIDFAVSLEGYDEWRNYIEKNDQIFCNGEKFRNEDNLKIIKFSVKDYGKGIDQKDFEKIFEPFSQASKETQSTHGGTGLGLSITSKLVKKLGGLISLDSEPGKFTEFCVHFPFRGSSVDVVDLSRHFEDITKPRGILHNLSSPTSVVARKGHLMTTENFQGLRILYADDNGINRKVLQRMVSCLGITDIDLVDDGTKAVEYAKSSSYDVIFLDMEMPVMGGIEACERITESDSSANIIFVTAHSFGEYRKRAEDAGAKDYITKPFDVKMIENVLQKAWNLAREDVSDKCASMEVDLDLAAATRTSFARALSIPIGLTLSSELKPFASDLRVLYADDNKINQKVLRKVLQRLDVDDVDLVDNGLKAVEKVKERTYDIIFMDIQMPVMDGLEASKRILEDNPAAVIIVVTAHALDQFRETAALTGCSDFISKPVNLKKIKSVLQQYAIFEE